MIVLKLRCVPPSTTAQMKRVRVVRGKPVFFHGAKMRREAATWSALLAPHAPAAPLDGPLALSVRLVYPHRKATPKRDLGRTMPKVSKPDLDGAAKHLIDQLTRLRFIADDARVARLSLEKWHGPESAVGIHITIAPLGAEENARVCNP